MKLTLLMILIFITSCTSTVTQQNIEQAQFPTKPSQSDAEFKINSYLLGVLKDPDSLKLECNDVKKGWARQYRDRSAEFGYIVPCTVNSKNSFGGYTGKKLYVFIFSTKGFKTLNGSKFREFHEHVGYID